MIHMSSNSIGSSCLSLSSPPFWCIFNIPIIAEQPEMSHLGTSLFPLHLCLLVKDANSPSSSSSASLFCRIPLAMLISPASQQLPQHPPSANEGCRLQLCPLSTPFHPSSLPSLSMKGFLWRSPLAVSLARSLLQVINVGSVNLGVG